MSSASSVNDALTSYAAGRITSDQLVGVVAAAYYREQGAGSREQLKPIIAVIEKAHPGMVELAHTAGRPGFVVRLAERPFPKRFEPELLRAVQAATAPGSLLLAPEAAPRSPLPAPGLFARIVGAIRRVFSA